MDCPPGATEAGQAYDGARRRRKAPARSSALCGRLPRNQPRETEAGSGAGGHVGGQDVVRVAVEAVAGPVIPHRGPRVGVTGSDLHVTQVSASVEHGRDKSYLYWILQSAW